MLDKDLRHVPKWSVLQYRQAKLDALTALSAAAEGYGPPGVHPHLPTVWLALRAELLAPAAPALLPADLVSAQQVSPSVAVASAKTLISAKLYVSAQQTTLNAAFTLLSMCRYLLVMLLGFLLLLTLQLLLLLPLLMLLLATANIGLVQAEMPKV